MGIKKYLKKLDLENLIKNTTKKPFSLNNKMKSFFPYHSEEEHEFRNPLLIIIHLFFTSSIIFSLILFYPLFYFVLPAGEGKKILKEATGEFLKYWKTFLFFVLRMVLFITIIVLSLFITIFITVKILG